jgi:two-component system chemotaxis response regulator CheY
MKTLIVEDDFTSRLLLQEMLRKFGEVHIAVNGREALQAAAVAMDAGAPYDLICLDIMMPEMDGHEALRALRAQEERHGIPLAHGSRIIMTTALDQIRSVIQSFQGFCDAYLVKPIEKATLMEKLKEFELI